MHTHANLNEIGVKAEKEEETVEKENRKMDQKTEAIVVERAK